jgi:hypothetical protein
LPHLAVAFEPLAAPCYPRCVKPLTSLLLIGGAFWLLSKKSEDRSKTGLPQDYVWFNEDFSEFEISTGWRIRVLDTWLKEQYDQGRIVTEHRPDLVAQWEGSPSFFLGAGQAANTMIDLGILALALAPGIQVAFTTLFLMELLNMISTSWFEDEIHKEAIASTGMGAFVEFVQTHDVYVGKDNKKMPMMDMPATPAVEEFVGIMGNYIGRFQSSDFGDAP